MWVCAPRFLPSPQRRTFYLRVYLTEAVHSFFFIAFTHKQTALLRRHIFHDTYIYVFYRQHAAPFPQISLRFWKARKVDVGIQVEKQVGQLFKG